MPWACVLLLVLTSCAALGPQWRASWREKQIEARQALREGRGE